MNIKSSSNQLQGQREVRTRTAAAVTVALLLAAAFVAHAQSQRNESQTPVVKSQVVTIRLGPDQIGLVKTGEKLSTRISFREPVKEVICGDLYDPSSGTGSFVIQRIDNDVFIKPVAPKGVSNMFVKTGGDKEYIYNFSLEIVPPEKAYLIVKVIGTWDDLSEELKPHSRVKPPAPPIISRVAFIDVRANGSTAADVGGLLTKLRHDLSLGAPPRPGTALRPRRVNYRSPIKRVVPEYPEIAKQTGVVGEVVVEVTINEEGKVKKARAVSGPLLLRNSALVAAKNWRFTPVEEGDAAAESIFTIKFNFQDPENSESHVSSPNSNVSTGERRRP